MIKLMEVIKMTKTFDYKKSRSLKEKENALRKKELRVAFWELFGEMATEKELRSTLKEEI